MGKRFTRITAQTYADHQQALSGQQVQVVDWSGRTYHGRLKAAEADFIVLEDLNAAWYNRRKHTHRLMLEDIREIVLDQVTPW
jgi:hypothetical protein